MGYDKPGPKKIQLISRYEETPAGNVKRVHELFLDGERFPWGLNNAWVESTRFDDTPSVVIEIPAAEVEVLHSVLPPEDKRK